MSQYMDKVRFEPFRPAPPLEDCRFYHVMDLPESGSVGAGWDLRHNIEAYLGNLEWQGKNVFDVGSASGYLTFEMEKRGAAVVSFDMRDDASFDIVPFVTHAGLQERETEAFREAVRAVKNSYWRAHRELNSRAKVYYGDIYDLPCELGAFDVVVIGMVLSHLKEPFRALESAARLSKDRIVIAQEMFNSDSPLSSFMPDPETGTPTMGWWAFSHGCVIRMLQVLGFDVESVTRGSFTCCSWTSSGVSDPESHEVTTIVGRRPGARG